MNLSQSTKTSLLISSCGITLSVAISGERGDIDTLVSSPIWGRMIPNVSVSRLPKASDSLDVSIECITEPFFRYNKSVHHIKADIGHTTSIVATIYYILEQARQEQMQYTVHGNLIGNSSGKAIALIGGISGIGKSTLSAYAQRHGWRWYSDDKFVINSDAQCVGGMTQPLKDAKTTKAINAQTIDAWHDTLTLSHIIIPLVTDEERLTVHYYDREKALWHMYEELSRDIRISNGLLDTFGPYPSFDTMRAAKNRRKSAQYYAETVPIIYVRGNPENILQFIEALYRA